MAFNTLKKGLGGLLGLNRSKDGGETKATSPKGEGLDAQEQALAPEAQENGLDAQEQALAPEAQENGFDAQEQALAPGSQGGGKKSVVTRAVGYVAGQVKLNLDERNRRKAAAAIKAVGSMEDVFGNWRYPIFRRLCEREWSIENLEFYEAITQGMDKKQLYETFVMEFKTGKDGEKEDNPNWVNLPGDAVRPLDELAQEGRYEEMDFKPLKKAALTNLADTFSRFKLDGISYEEAYKHLYGSKGSKG